MRDISNNPRLFSINTGSLGYKEPLENIIKECEKRNIGYISPWRSELVKKDLAKLKNLLDESNIKVNSLCRSSYYTAQNKQQRNKAIDDNKRALDYAAQLGASNYIQVVGSLYPFQKNLQEVRKQVKEGIFNILEHSKEVGVSIAIEPLHPMTCGDRSCITSLREALDLCDELDPYQDFNLGVVVDVYHVWWDAYILEQIKRASSRILSFHVSDWLLTTSDLVNDRGMPGEGCIDIKYLRKSVEEAGFSGPIELEVFSSKNWWNLPLSELLDICVRRISEYC